MSFTDWFALLNFRVLNKYTKAVFNSDFFLLILKELWPKFVEPNKIVESDFWREKLVKIPGIRAKVASTSGFYSYIAMSFFCYSKHTLLFIEDLLNENSNNYVYFWLKMNPKEIIITQDLKAIWATRGFDSKRLLRLENTVSKKLSQYTDGLFKESDLQEGDYFSSTTKMDITVSLPLLLGLPEIAEKNATYLKKEGLLEDLIVCVVLQTYCKIIGFRNFVLFTQSELIEKLGTEKLRNILACQE